MHASSAIVFFVVLVGLALSVTPVAAGRPEWMAKAPPLPVSGNIVHVTSSSELDHAVRHASDGDTVLVADGVYQLDRLLHLRGRTGVTIRGESGDPAKAVIRGTGFEDRESGFDLLVIHGCADITVAHLTFEETSSYGVKLENTHYEGRGLESISIYDCRFVNCGTRMVKGTGGDGVPVVGGSIRYCTFENTKVPPRTWLFEGDYISAIDCMRLVDWTITDNYFANIRGANGGGRGAVFVWVESKNVVTERNVFVGCDRSICYGNPSGSDFDAPSFHMTDGAIRNNFVVAGADKGIEICWADGVEVSHNTVLADVGKGWAIHCHWRELRDVRVRNNLVRGQILGEEGMCASGNVAASVDDAWFRDAARGDLHLTDLGSKSVAREPRTEGCDKDFDGEARAEKTLAGADEVRPE
jgi:hypothetical protein